MNYVLTNHAKNKLRQYALSESRILRVLNSPQRVEEGIADNTIAAVQRAGSVKNPYEIWVMVVKDKVKGSKIISAWKYPGITKPGESLPSSILLEFNSMEY